MKQFVFLLIIVAAVFSFIYIISSINNSKAILEAYKNNPRSIICKDDNGNTIEINSSWHLIYNNIDGYIFEKRNKPYINIDNCSVIVNNE